MKLIPLLILLLAAGCSTSNLVKVSPRPPATVADNLRERVRYPEVVADYHLGRYVDPSQPLLMHEAHTLYRVEGVATWNLHSPPGSFVLPGHLVAATNPAFAPPPANDAVIAELNQQHAMTRAMQQQAESLNDSLRDFSNALSSTRGLMEQNKLLREEILKLNQRLNVLESAAQQMPRKESTVTGGGNE